jgi:hypothetical protein
VVLIIIITTVYTPPALHVLAIVMSVRLRFRVSDYPFGIFKRFLSILIWFIISDIACKDIGAFQYSRPVHVVLFLYEGMDEVAMTTNGTCPLSCVADSP